MFELLGLRMETRDLSKATQALVSLIGRCGIRARSGCPQLLHQTASFSSINPLSFFPFYSLSRSNVKLKVGHV